MVAVLEKGGQELSPTGTVQTLARSTSGSQQQLGPTGLVISLLRTLSVPHSGADKPSLMT